MIKEIVEQWHDANFTMVDEVAQAELINELERELIPRADAAAALKELQVEIDALLDRPLQWPTPTVYNRQAAFQAIATTITKLGLAPGKDGENG